MGKLFFRRFGPRPVGELRTYWNGDSFLCILKLNLKVQLYRGKKMAHILHLVLWNYFPTRKVQLGPRPPLPAIRTFFYISYTCWRHSKDGSLFYHDICSPVSKWRAARRRNTLRARRWADFCSDISGSGSSSTTKFLCPRESLVLLTCWEPTALARCLFQIIFCPNLSHCYDERQHIFV